MLKIEEKKLETIETVTALMYLIQLGFMDEEKAKEWFHNKSRNFVIKTFRDQLLLKDLLI